MRKLFDAVTDFVSIGGLFLAIVLYAASAHATTSKHSETTCWLPEGCVTQYTSNPLMYQAANLATTPDAVANVDGNLNLRIKPLGTYMLYDESLLFCGMPIDKFRGKTEPFVLTYERVAHRTVQGLGCHVLVRVDQVTPEVK